MEQKRFTKQACTFVYKPPGQRPLSEPVEMLLNLILLMYVCTLRPDRLALSQTYCPILYFHLGTVTETDTVPVWKIQSASALDNPWIHVQSQLFPRNCMCAYAYP